jgi:hypothetical protein
MNDGEEQASFAAKNFNLQDITITLLGNADEACVYFYASLNYAISDICTESVIKTSGS